MRAFVTGASGFIGGHLVGRLAEGGWTVVALDLAAPFPAPPGVETVGGDVRDPGPWKKALAGTDVLFHLAAALGASRLTEEEFLKINAGGTEAVLGAAREAGVRKAVCASSAGVIGAIGPGAVAVARQPALGQESSACQGCLSCD